MNIERITLELDEDDYPAVLEAIQQRQEYSLPEGEGNIEGRCIGEICRGWEEMRQCSTPELLKQMRLAVAFYQTMLVNPPDEEIEQSLRAMIKDGCDAMGVPVPPDGEVPQVPA